MHQRRFMQVDVFSSIAYQGNPLAVVVDGDGLSDEAMQAFARWTNLSETTFLLPPTDSSKTAGADYRVRIFTPGGELPFAGHPTLGSCAAWLAAGGVPQRAGTVVQECAKGLVPLRKSDTHPGEWAFAAPALARSTPSEAELAPIIDALGLQRNQVLACERLDNGPVFCALLLSDPDLICGLTPNLPALWALNLQVGLAAIYPHTRQALIARANREARAFHTTASTTAAADMEVRVFYNMGTALVEDPITGSFNASLAQWLIADGHIQAPYTASQGVNLNRSGTVRISQDAHGQIWVGGPVNHAITGTVQL